MLLHSSFWIHQICYPYNDLYGVLPESRDGSDTFSEARKRNSADDDKQIESDSNMHKTLDGIQDQEFCSLFQLPPEKVPNLLLLY